MKLNIPNFLCDEQRELARLLKEISVLGFDWRRTSLKCVSDVYHCTGQMVKDAMTEEEMRGMSVEGYCDIYSSKVEGMTRAEIAAIIIALSEFGVDTELTGDKPEPNAKAEATSGLTYAEVVGCTSYKEVLMLLRRHHMDAQLSELLEFQDREVNNGRRLTTKKCADFLFPKRPAGSVKEQGRPSKIEVSKRGHSEAIALIEEFAKIGITEVSYGEKVSKEIRQNFASLMLLCANAPQNIINEAKLSS